MRGQGTYHLDGDAQHGLEVELSAALLEEIFKTLAKEVHDHHVVGLVIVRLLVAHEVEVGHAGYIGCHALRPYSCHAACG